MMGNQATVANHNRQRQSSSTPNFFFIVKKMTKKMKMNMKMNEMYKK